jgi:hypothetical protein
MFELIFSRNGLEALMVVGGSNYANDAAFLVRISEALKTFDDEIREQGTPTLVRNQTGVPANR